MRKRQRGWFTVPELFELLGFEPLKRDTWSVGNRARDEYVDATGELPPKALAKKTNARGSHCFAAYPPEWMPRLSDIVRAVATMALRQRRLLQ